MKKDRIEDIETLDHIRLWLDDEHGIRFKVEISEGKEPRFTQEDGHKLITNFDRKQLENYIACLCAMLNRYNVN